MKTGWLAYPIIIKKNSKIKRRDMQIYLEKRNSNENNFYGKYFKTTYYEK